MHSNRISIVIGLIILIINLFLLTIYASKQGKFTFSFFFSVCREIKVILQRWLDNFLREIKSFGEIVKYKGNKKT